MTFFVNLNRKIMWETRFIDQIEKVAPKSTTRPKNI